MFLYFADKNNGKIPHQCLSAYFDEVKLLQRGVSCLDRYPEPARGISELSGRLGPPDHQGAP